MDKFKKNLVLFSLSILFSCRPNPTLDGESPFVVSKIEYNGKDMCLYYGPINNTSRVKIIIPCRLYNIGDTISIIK